MSVLISAVITLSFLSLFLGWFCFRLLQAQKSEKEFQLERRAKLADEMEVTKRYLSSIFCVLNSHVGGITKRLSESSLIAEAIYTNAPELFTKCGGLAYWLHANDQFLAELYAVSAVGIGIDHRRDICDQEMTGREKIFMQIYEMAGLLAPVYARFQHS